MKTRHSINTTKGNVSLKQKHETHEKLSSLTKEKVNLEDRLTEMESHSMHENLLFQELPENVNENYDTIVKDFCKIKLGVNQ